MKTEAPDKIYLIRNISTPTSLNITNDCHEKYLQEWYKGREKDTDVEYTRTDVFIEKAVSYLEGTLFNEVCYGEIRPDIVQTYINDFKKAMYETDRQIHFSSGDREEKKNV